MRLDSRLVLTRSTSCLPRGLDGWSRAQPHCQRGETNKNSGCPLPLNCHHASPQREKSAVNEDWDPNRERCTFPENRHSRIQPPLFLLSPPPLRESTITALSACLDSRRIPPPSPSSSHFLLLETKFIMAATTGTTTRRSHARGIRSSFAFRSGLAARMGYGHWMHPLRA